MIVTYGTCWVTWLFGFLLFDSENTEYAYSLFMVVFNIIQPIVQASLAAYISNSYDVGVLSKNSDPLYLPMWYTLIFSAVSTLILNIGGVVTGYLLLIKALSAFS